MARWAAESGSFVIDPYLLGRMLLNRGSYSTPKAQAAGDIPDTAFHLLSADSKQFRRNMKVDGREPAGVLRV